MSPRKLGGLRHGLHQPAPAAARLFAAACLAACGILWSAAGAFAGGFFVVDGANPNCSDSGPGTVAVPFCTITEGVTHGGPGIAVFVKPHVYREQVTVPFSGAAGNPFTIQAMGTPVVVDGAEDFSSPGLWSNVSGDRWLASSVTWEPVQVIVDGSRLSAWQSDPGTLPSGSFRFVSGEGLYVNLGGGNPGSHNTEVSRRSHAFRLPGRSWVTLEGFTIRHTRDHGIYLFGLMSPGSNVIVRSNDISVTAAHGIGVVTYSDVTIANNKVYNNQDHGISLINGVTNSTIENNDCYLNSRPSVRAASGIYLHGSAANVIQNNRSHDNQDSGIEIDSLSSDVLCRQNLVWSNGDHGIAQLRSSNVSHFGDVSWGNHKDGFSIEANSPDAILFNCIGVDNGLTTNEYDLFVDPSSTSGFTSNYNIFWNSTSQNPIRYNGTQYATVAAYNGATGLDATTIQANPGFINPVAGNFNLPTGSPAIDSGYSGTSSWPAFDADGRSRYDDPATANTGAGGPVTYADRGALEYQGMSQTGRDDTPSIEGLFFSSAFPNPSFGKVSFILEMPRAARVEWSVMDLQGRSVWSESFESGPGRRILDWEGRDRGGSPARVGVYHARVRVGGVLFARRFMLVR